MFCCRNTASFSPAHELDSSIRRKTREKPVVSIQPGATSAQPPQTSATTTTGSVPAKSEDGEDADDGDSKNKIPDGRRVRGGVRAATVNTNKEIPSYTKLSHVAVIIKCAIMNNQFLNQLRIPDHIVDQVVQAMAPREVSAGEDIIIQGEVGDKFFVNEKGTYQIIIDKKLFLEFSNSVVFGELAMLYKQKRAATVRATTAGKIWMIDGETYRTLIILDAKFQEEQRLRFLRKVRILDQCNDDKLRQIANLLKTNFHPTNSVIIKQGHVGDKFFIIQAGNVTITKDGEVVAKISESDYFGEKAMMETDKRQATCIAEAPGVTCLELSRQDFIDHLGQFQEFITKVSTPPEIQQKRPSSVMPEEDITDVTNLVSIATIGEGGFGRVKLMVDKENQKHYALKMLPKVENNTPEQRNHVINEKNIHKACKCYFIVKLYKTYADSRYLYFVMEPCMGGDLFAYMQTQPGRCFSEENARFIAGCILEALAYLHSQHFIYRDLKPENMLIDENGYIKLADFGFAKKVSSGSKTFTFAGTPEYVAPEVIYNTGHNKAVDYWAFGIFIFELLAGKTPFKSNDPSYMITYGLILKGIENIQFPMHIHKHAGSLIRRLCRLTPHERIGCQKRGVDDIRKHKWFQKFNWLDLQNRKIYSPFKPKLDSPYDMKYFDDFDEDYPEPKADYNTNWADFDS